MCVKLGSALASMAATCRRAARQSGASVHRARQALLNSSVLATESQDLRSGADSAGSEHEPITRPITPISTLTHYFIPSHPIPCNRVRLQNYKMEEQEIHRTVFATIIKLEGGGNYFFDNLMKKPTQKVGQVIDFIGRGERI